MKKVILRIIAAVLVIGVLAGFGYAAYRTGYTQGVQQAAANGDTQLFRRFGNFDPQRMPMHNFGNDFGRDSNRGMGPTGFPMMGFGFIPPLLFLGRIVMFGLAIWFIYWLFTRSGWRITRTPPAMATTPPNTEGGNQNAEANK